MTRIETNYVNPNVRVNPLVVRKIEVLEQVLQQGGSVDESLFEPYEIRLTNKKGLRGYLAHLYKIRASDEAPSEE